MKSVIYLLFFSLIMRNYLFSQQSNLNDNNAKAVYPMAIFKPNEPQNVLETGAITKKIDFQLFSTQNFKTSFIERVMKNPLVISCNYDKNYKSGTLVHMDLSPETDFDNFKSLLKSAGIMYVSIEDTLLFIENWKPFSKEELEKIVQLNANIYNIEFKRNWVMEHENERKMAIENGWFEENSTLLKNAKKEKADFIRLTLKNK